ncbi:MAG: hypothetical protein WC735_03890 [Candidatus Paceibacterota bacterium]|jgi:ABC-type transporter Mla subunit MlaD
MDPEKKSNGALVGLIVIIIILIIGGIYLWQSNKSPATNTINGQTESVSTTDSTELDTLGQEVDVADIDVGANAINSVQ